MLLYQYCKGKGMHGRLVDVLGRQLGCFAFEGSAGVVVVHYLVAEISNVVPNLFYAVYHACLVVHRSFVLHGELA